MKSMMALMVLEDFVASNAEELLQQKCQENIQEINSMNVVIAMK